MKKKFLLIFIYIIALLVIIPNDVHAKTLQNLYDELSSLQSKYNNSKSKQNMTQNELNNVNNEVIAINNNIKSTQNEITAAENKIAESENKIAEKKEETAELLKFLQLSNSENIYLEYLFDAEDVTDFIYRFAVVSQLSEYNTSLMNELENLIKELENNKVALNEKQKQLEEQKTTLAAKLDTLRMNLNDSQIEGTTIAQDIADLKKEIAYYEKLGCKRTSNLTSCSATPVASGWRYPLDYGSMTSPFTGSKNRSDAFGGSHYAVDIAGPSEGANVYSAAAGTVARIVYKSSCGGNQVYIHHIVGGTAYTTVYMHLLTVNVSQGQIVTDSTVIGTIGGGRGTSSYDRCSTGTHLHFGISYGHYGSNYSLWTANAFNPTTIFSFPFKRI